MDILGVKVYYIHGSVILVCWLINVYISTQTILANAEVHTLWKECNCSIGPNDQSIWDTV